MFTGTNRLEINVTQAGDAGRIKRFGRLLGDSSHSFSYQHCQKTPRVSAWQLSTSSHLNSSGLNRLDTWNGAVGNPDSAHMAQHSSLVSLWQSPRPPSVGPFDAIVQSSPRPASTLSGSEKEAYSIPRLTRRRRGAKCAIHNAKGMWDPCLFCGCWSNQ